MSCCHTEESWDSGGALLPLNTPPPRSHFCAILKISNKCLITPKVDLSVIIFRFEFYINTDVLPKNRHAAQKTSRTVNHYYITIVVVITCKLPQRPSK